MPMSPADFWKLVVQSSVLTTAECQHLGGKFASNGGANATDAAPLAEWLVRERALSRFQAKVLLAGRAGPFAYGDYKVFDRVSGGRLAGLFRAVHLESKHVVGLHFLAGAVAQDALKLANARERSAAAAAVRHPCLWRTHELVDLNSYKFVVVADHCSGKSLEDFLGGKKTAAPIEACRIVRQAALALAELHAKNLIHGDLRPANFWMDSAGQLKLLAFPFVLEPPPVSERKSLGVFLAPELAAGGSAADARSDVYGLGCVLYQLLAGSAPATTGNALAQLDRVNASVPKILAQAVAKMLAVDPAARMPDAASVVQALTPFVPAAAAKVPAPAATAESQAFESWLTRPRSAAVAARPASPAVPMAQPMIATAQPIMQVQPVMSVQQAVPVHQAVPMAQPVQVAAFPSVAALAAAPEPLDFTSVTSSSDDGPSHRPWRRKRRSGLGVVVAGFVLLLGIAGVGALVGPPLGLFNLPGDPLGNNLPTETASTDGGKGSTGNGSTKTVKPVVAKTPVAVDPGGEQFLAVEEDLWRSPTKGKPIDLAWLPGGVQAVISLRPAAILKHEEGAKTIEALGPLGELLKSTLTSLGGVAPESIDQALIGLLDGAEGMPRVALVVRSREAVPTETLLAAWNNPSETTIGDFTVYSGEAVTYFIPKEGKNKLWAVAPLLVADEIEDWLKNAKQPDLRIELAALSASSDRDRHFSLLFAPSFFSASGGGRALFTGPGEKLKEPLEAFLIDDTNNLPKAGLLSVHVDKDFFAELRVYCGPGEAAFLHAKEYRDRVREFSLSFEGYLAGLDAHDYGKKILFRFTRMLEKFGQFTRAGADQRQAVLRCYLPTVAAHNLALAGQLAVLEGGGGGGASPTAVAAAEKPKTLREKLDEKMDFTLPNTPLDGTMQQFSEMLGVPIEIVGPDFQLEGITKNQRVSCDEKDKTVSQILQAILMKASPADKLVFLIKEEEGKETLLLTTRAAAEKRKDTIPPEFVRPAKKEK